MTVPASLSTVPASIMPSTLNPQQPVTTASIVEPASYHPLTWYESFTGLGLSGDRKRGIDETDLELTQQGNCSLNKRHKAAFVEGQRNNASDVTVSEAWSTGAENSDNVSDTDEYDEKIVDALLERWTVVTAAS